MAYDTLLAERIRPLLAATDGMAEKKMFGGIAFQVHGNIAVGVHGAELIVRLDPADVPAALRQSGVRPFDITGRPMKGWVMVQPSAVASDAALAAWVRRGTTFAATLPRK